MFYGSGNKCQEIQGEGAEDRKRVINVYISCEMSDYRLYKLKALWYREEIDGIYG